MSYAIIRTGGKQYRVAEGDHLKVDLLGIEKGATVTFDNVLFVGNDGAFTVGSPLVSGAKVTGTVIDAERKGPKVYAFKLKRRKGYRNKKGHRQRYTQVKIDSIVG